MGKAIALRRSRARSLGRSLTAATGLALRTSEVAETLHRPMERLTLAPGPFTTDLKCVAPRPNRRVRGTQRSQYALR
jgi:hypothetical protein